MSSVFDSQISFDFQKSDMISPPAYSEEKEGSEIMPPSILIPSTCSLPKLPIDYEEDWERYPGAPLATEESNQLHLAELAQRKEQRCHQRIHSILEMCQYKRSLYLSGIPFEDIAFMFSRSRCWFRALCLKSMPDDIQNNFLHYWQKFYLVYIDSRLPQ